MRALDDLASGRTPWPAYVFGPAGVGKTAAGLWMFDRFQAIYIEASKLADTCYSPQDVIWRLAEDTTHLVIVDEVARITEREYLGMKRLADIRYRGPTLWLSNLSPEMLRGQTDDRLYSRLCCGTVVEVVGPDQRFER